MRVVKYNDVPWFDPQAERGETSKGIQRRVIAEDQDGFYVGSNYMPPGLRIEPHKHNEDEIMIVLEGGLELDGGEKLCAHDMAFLEAETTYGFTVGTDGVRFAIVRRGKATIEFANGAS